MSEKQDGHRRYWSTCDNCLVSITIEMHPDAGPNATFPDEEEWEDGYPDCPVCGRGQGWEGADPTTSWEDRDALIERFQLKLASMASMGPLDGAQ